MHKNEQDQLDDDPDLPGCILPLYSGPKSRYGDIDSINYYRDLLICIFSKQSS
jgi:hypothetical protein